MRANAAVLIPLDLRSASSFSMSGFAAIGEGESGGSIACGSIRQGCRRYGVSTRWAHRTRTLQSSCAPLAVHEGDEWLEGELGDDPETDDSRGSGRDVKVGEAEHVEWYCEHCEAKTRSRMMWLGRVVAAAIVAVCFFLPEILGLTP